MNRPVTFTTTLTRGTRQRLKVLATMFSRNQGQIIEDAVLAFMDKELTAEQRSSVEDMVRHSVEIESAVAVKEAAGADGAE